MMLRQKDYLDFQQFGVESSFISVEYESKFISFSPSLDKQEEFNFDKPVMIVTYLEDIVSGSRLEELQVFLAQKGYSGTLGGYYNMANDREKITLFVLKLGYVR